MRLSPCLSRRAVYGVNILVAYQILAAHVSSYVDIPADLPTMSEEDLLSLGPSHSKEADACPLPQLSSPGMSEGRLRTGAAQRCGGVFLYLST